MPLMSALLTLLSFAGCPLYASGCVPPNAVFPYGVVNATIPCTFGGVGSVTLCIYERGGDCHARAMERMRRLQHERVTRRMHFLSGMALITRKRMSITQEKGCLCALHVEMDMRVYENAAHYLDKEDCLC